MKRRAFIATSGAAALVAATPAQAQLFRGRKLAALVERCRAHLAKSFPASVMAQPATDTFLAAYAEHALDRPDLFPEDGAFFHFLTSTTVIAHLETGEDLSFDVIFDPHDAPCSNHLGALYAPDGEHDA